MALPHGRARREELARRCGLSRPKMSQELKRLKAAGHLRIGHGMLQILDLEGLAWMQEPVPGPARLP